MGKKDASVMQAQRDRFVQGAVERGLPKKKATRIFDLMEFFAGYGFNKSHSTTYALLAYQTAYLKSNHPWHFMASLLTIERQNTDKLSIYLGECRDIGIPILPPDVNASSLHFTVTKEGIRFGLTAIKNAGESAMSSIITVREAQGRIDSLNRLCEEADLRLVNKRVLESLTKAGAFDSLSKAAPEVPKTDLRAQLLAISDRALEHGNRRQRDRERGQTELFSESDADELSGDSVRFPGVTPWTDAQQLLYEKEALGLYLSGHPVDRFVPYLRAHNIKRIEELTKGSASESIVGIVGQRRLLTTKKGQPMAVVTLEDRGGTLEAVLFPGTYKKHSSTIEPDSLVVAHGRLEKEEELSRLIVSDLVTMEALVEESRGVMAIRLVTPPHDRKTLESLAEIFGRYEGNGKVSLEIELRRKRNPLRLTAALSHVRIRPSDQLLEEVERLCGKGTASWM